jgi:hypothetical protein
MYCDAISIPVAMRNAMIGSPAHKITLKEGIESFA